MYVARKQKIFGILLSQLPKGSEDNDIKIQIN